MVGESLCLYLGVPEAAWLARSTVPMCVSYGRVRRIKGKLPVSPPGGHWMLDSRGYNELQNHGRWTITAREYVAAVFRYDQEIGNLGWAAAQDHMCEPEIIYGGVHRGRRYVGTRRFLDPDERMSFDDLVLAQLRLTVANFVQCCDLWSDLPTNDDCPFMPTFQGYLRKHYQWCWDLYLEAGVRISEHYPLAAVGSVCSRQDTTEITAIVESLRRRDPEIHLHGFGVKQGGLRRAAWTSADSQAWSFNARYGPKHPDCTAKHQTCASCMTYALSWYEQVVGSVDRPAYHPLAVAA